MTINTGQWCIEAGTYAWKVRDFHKEGTILLFPCESYMYLLLSLSCVIP